MVVYAPTWVYLEESYQSGFTEVQEIFDLYYTHKDAENRLLAEGFEKAAEGWEGARKGHATIQEFHILGKNPNEGVG